MQILRHNIIGNPTSKLNVFIYKATFNDNFLCYCLTFVAIFSEHRHSDSAVNTIYEIVFVHEELNANLKEHLEMSHIFFIIQSSYI